MSREYDRAAGQGPEPVFIVVEQEDNTFKSTNANSPLPVKAGGDLGVDAWERQKVVQDATLFHGMFTYDIPAAHWYESIDNVEQTVFASATSVDGKLRLASGALNVKRQLQTFQYPRYEPNRGHLFSTSMFLPAPSANGQRSFGVFTAESGYMFRLRAGTLYAVRRTTIQGVTTDTETAIPLPEGLLLEKGNTFDIQAQWRGVGNVNFAINNKIVLRLELLGTLTELSSFNPALPIAFECIDQGDAVEMFCGCVDVSSEGGSSNGKTYGSIGANNNTGSVAIVGPNAYNVPIMVARNKKQYDALINTRDISLLQHEGYGDQRCVIRLWKTRDASRITLNDQPWVDYGDGHLEYVYYKLNEDGSGLVGTPVAFDITGLTPVYTSRVDIDSSHAASGIRGRKDITIPFTPGDIIVLTMHRETGGSASVGVFFEFLEAI